VDQMNTRSGLDLGTHSLTFCSSSNVGGPGRNRFPIPAINDFASRIRSQGSVVVQTVHSEHLSLKRGFGMVIGKRHIPCHQDFLAPARPFCHSKSGHHHASFIYSGLRLRGKAARERQFLHGDQTALWQIGWLAETLSTQPWKRSPFLLSSLIFPPGLPILSGARF
jgi:hypothetical protein